MKDIEYSTYRDGKHVTVPKIDDLCLALKEKFLRQEEEIDHLKKENERIKSVKYASEEMQKMKNKLDQMEKDYWNGFPISDDKLQKINEWKEKHDAEKHNAKTSDQRLRLGGVSGGRFSYIFVPTSLGIIGKIRCSCGEEFCFRGLN